MNLPPGRSRLTAWLATAFTVLLTWSVLAVGFHRHVESGPRHDCQVCTATHVQATSVRLATLPPASLRPLELVVATADQSPRIFPHVFVPNRAPPLS